MIFKHCPNCKTDRGFKRNLGWGTFFAAVLTLGFWILIIPFYPKRCISCGYELFEDEPLKEQFLQTYKPVDLKISEPIKIIPSMPYKNWLMIVFIFIIAFFFILGLLMISSKK